MENLSEVKQHQNPTLENFKSLLDELQVQANLGKREAKDLINRERKILRTYITKERAFLKKTTQDASQHEINIMNKFSDLQDDLDKKIPNGKSAFDSYKKDVLKDIYALEYAIKTESYDVRKSLFKNLESFKTKLDAYRLQVAMSDYDSRDQLEDQRIELNDKINNIRKVIKDREAQDKKWDSFSEEVTSSFKHMKNAFSELLG